MNFVIIGIIVALLVLTVISTPILTYLFYKAYKENKKLDYALNWMVKHADITLLETELRNIPDEVEKRMVLDAINGN